VVVALVMGLVASGWAVLKMLEAPAVLPVIATAADGAAAQQKLYIALRRGTAAEPVTLTEREVNALAVRNLETGADLSVLSLRLIDRDTVELLGRIPVGRLMAEVSAAPGTLPASWRGRLVWLRIRGTPTLEGTVQAGAASRRYVTLGVDAAWIGRVRVPVVLLRLLVDPGTFGALRWRAPVALREIRVEPGRIIIRVASRDAS
jgi:hypothetical protein